MHLSEEGITAQRKKMAIYAPEDGIEQLNLGFDTPRKTNIPERGIPLGEIRITPRHEYPYNWVQLVSRGVTIAVRNSSLFGVEETVRAFLSSASERLMHDTNVTDQTKTRAALFGLEIEDVLAESVIEPLPPERATTYDNQHSSDVIIQSIRTG